MKARRTILPYTEHEWDGPEFAQAETMIEACLVFRALHGNSTSLSNQHIVELGPNVIDESHRDFSLETVLLGDGIRVLNTFGQASKGSRGMSWH